MPKPRILVGSKEYIYLAVTSTVVRTGNEKHWVHGVDPKKYTVHTFELNDKVVIKNLS
jgi:hypothetical protein